MFEFKFQNVLHTRIHFFCAFALVFIMLALVPELSSFVSTVQSEVGHGAGKPRACHHLWEIAHSFLLLYWLQSTKTLPSGLCFNGLVACLMPSMRIHDYTSWLCIIINTNVCYWKNTFFSISFFYTEFKNSSISAAIMLSYLSL